MVLLLSKHFLPVCIVNIPGYLVALEDKHAPGLAETHAVANECMPMAYEMLPERTRKHAVEGIGWNAQDLAR